MAARSWLDEVQARAAVLGMSTVDLALAAGMKPGNLRRVLKGSPESPRLGTMMRLLAPLGCRISPAGARTAGELAVHLDAQRRRRNVDWAAVCEGSRVTARIAERFVAAPEAMSVGVAFELARRLDVELTVVADDAASSPAHEPAAVRGRAPRAPRARPAPAPEAASSSPPSPAVSPSQEPSSASRWRLRPPRLGRYRDAPVEAARERPSPIVYVPPVPSYALERAVLDKLADLTADDWSSAYTELFQFVAGAARTPVKLIRGMARATEQWFVKFRRPGAPEAEHSGAPEAELDGTPDSAFAGADPAPLIQAWMRSKSPDGDVEVAHTRHDELGRVHKVHLALDSRFGVVVRLGQGETPHVFARLFFFERPGAATLLSEPEVPLVLRVGDVQRRFAHADAGPVFAELAQAGRVFLLAAISWTIVLVQVDSGGARVLWGGRPEEFVEMRVDGSPR